MEDEIRPLVKGAEWREWTAVRTPYRSYESSRMVVVCAGIGAEAALRATEAVIEAESPQWVVSAGFAGAIVPWLMGGDLVIPDVVVAAESGERFDCEGLGLGQGQNQDAEGQTPHLNAQTARVRVGHPSVGEPAMAVVSIGQIAGRESKPELARRFGAQAIDMEAATVAEVARRRGLGFTAVKAISDEVDLELPDMGPFVDASGRFSRVRFVAYALPRPGIWSVVARLASNRAKASRSLCGALERLEETLREASGNRVIAESGN